MKSLSLQKKFMLIVGGSIAVMLSIAATILVNIVADNTRERVQQDVSALVAREANEVEGFFNKYGGVAETFLSSPFLKTFFYEHTQRGGEDGRVKNSAKIYQLFTNISHDDPVIKSAFFGSALTGEYFYEEGRVGVDTSGPNAGNPDYGYFTTKRPWFNAAVDAGQLYVTPPAVDSQDGSISAVVQKPVYEKGRLIGVGGVDILISTIGKVIDSIRYQGQGTAFLLDENQNIVYFPKQGKELPLSSSLANFDTLFDETSAFSTLAGKISTASDGMVEVTWKGKEYVAFFRHANLTSPHMDWSLGILIPASIIDGPIEGAITTAIIIALIIIVLIALITFIASAKITTPLVNMRYAMAEIARGEGDLTKRLTVHSNDEIGALFGDNEDNVLYPFGSDSIRYVGDVWKIENNEKVDSEYLMFDEFYGNKQSIITYTLKKVKKKRGDLIAYITVENALELSGIGRREDRTIEFTQTVLFTGNLKYNITKGITSSCKMSGAINGKGRDLDDDSEKNFYMSMDLKIKNKLK